MSPPYILSSHLSSPPQVRKTLWSEIAAKAARKTPKSKAVPAAATKQAKSKPKVPRPQQSEAGRKKNKKTSVYSGDVLRALSGALR